MVRRIERTKGGSPSGRPDGEPRIELKEVSFQYGEVPTIRDVTFAVRAGEFVSVVGPSGCGKTTCIDLISGFRQPSAGDIRINGRPTAPNMIHQDIAMMFARGALLPWRTALGNVQLAFDLMKPARDPGAAEDVSLATSAVLLEKVGLRGFEHYYPDRLSQGMRQRVALARTLASNRPILVMDEPFSALDAQTRTVIQGEFLRLWETYRKTVILVTHDLIEAIAMSDRVLVMSSAPGTIKADYEIALDRPRSVSDVYASPQFLELYQTIRADLETSAPSLS